jgi:hypothetical protein
MPAVFCLNSGVVNELEGQSYGEDKVKRIKSRLSEDNPIIFVSHWANSA